MSDHRCIAGVCKICGLSLLPCDTESECPGTKDPTQAILAALTRDHTLTLHSCASGSMYAWQEVIGGPAKLERQFLHNRDHVSHYQDVEGVDLDEDGFGFVWTKEYFLLVSSQHQKLPL